MAEDEFAWVHDSEELAWVGELQDERDTLARRVEELEAALREIASLDWHHPDDVVVIAREALAGGAADTEVYRDDYNPNAEIRP